MAKPKYRVLLHEEVILEHESHGIPHETAE